MRTQSPQKSLTANEAVLMPNSVPANATPSFRSVHNDFIPHPARFPLRYRRTGLWQRRLHRADDSAGDLGLTFRSRKRLPIGAAIEVSIPLRGDVQKFRGTVVLVREMAEDYEIGVWF